MHIKNPNNAHFVFLIQIKAMDGGQNDVKHHGEEKNPLTVKHYSKRMPVLADDVTHR